jgi:hypothetical protein
MGITFISSPGGTIKSGTIVLWSGAKSAIPTGWEYYSAAASKLVAGAVSASTTPQGGDNHTHGYASKTGKAGGHTHSVSISQGAPTNEFLPGIFSGGTKNADVAERYHANHPVSVTVSTVEDHDHSLSATGSSKNLPLSVGLYFIRKV